MSDVVKKTVEDIVSHADEKKGSDIAVFNILGKSIITDYVVIISVTNTIHCKAMIEGIKDVSKDIRTDENFFCPPKKSGTPESGWIILDLNSIIVHVILDELRQEYELDAIYDETAVLVQE